MAQGWHYGGLIGKTPTRGGTLGGSATNIATSGVYSPGGFSPDLNTNTVPTSQSENIEAWIKATYLPANASIVRAVDNDRLDSVTSTSTTNTSLCVAIYNTSTNSGAIRQAGTSGIGMNGRLRDGTANDLPIVTVASTGAVAAHGIPNTYYSGILTQTTDEPAVFIVFQHKSTYHGLNPGTYNSFTSTDGGNPLGGIAQHITHVIFRQVSTNTVFDVTMDQFASGGVNHALANVTSSVAAYSSTKNVQVPGKSLQRWGGLVGRSIYTDDPVTLRNTGVITTTEAYQTQL